MQGNQACAEGAMAAGCRFFAGYPITPSSEIAEWLALRFPEVGGKFIQMEDEIGAMGAVIGASLTGVKAMTATSGPGFSLKQENIGYAAMAEVPCVVVDVQRGGPSTGMPTLPSQMDVQQARWGAHGDHGVIALTASSAQETFEQTIRAFNLAETYMMPVLLLLDEIVGHTTERIVIPDWDTVERIDRKQPEVPPDEYLPYRCPEGLIPVLANFGTGYRYNITGLCHNETGFPTNNKQENESLVIRLTEKIVAHRNEIIRLKRMMLDDADIVIFAYGTVARSARQAVMECREQGIKAGLLEATVLWPFPTEEVYALAGSVNAFVVPELNLGQMAREVELAVRCAAPVHRLNRVDGDPITPLQILDAVKEVV
ncbi:MAG: 2-oxoacid:acceptor oxidoreductase subunit alpha [bacterium]|nr:MAG: 2-oxoacid:acceptor oxidoreductase subunit alpha [bacterium]